MSGPSERDEIAVTEIAEVLASWCSKSGDDMNHYLCGELVHRQHREQAEALMHWLAERDRRTAATAVREAAEQASDPDNAYVQTTNGYVARWLRDRADRIERGE